MIPVRIELDGAPLDLGRRDFVGVPCEFIEPLVDAAAQRNAPGDRHLHRPRRGGRDPARVHPVLVDILGVKRWQSEGVVDPEGERTRDVQVDPNHMKSMAIAYLRKLGRDPESPPDGMKGDA